MSPIKCKAPETEGKGGGAACGTAGTGDPVPPVPRRPVPLSLPPDPGPRPQGGQLPYSGDYAGSFTRDAPFDPAILQTVPSRLCVQVLWNGAPTAGDLQGVLATLKQTMEQNGLPVTYYDVTLVPLDGYDSHEELMGMVVESGPVAAADIG